MSDEPEVDKSNPYYRYGYHAGLSAGKEIGRIQAKIAADYAARVKKDESIVGRVLASWHWFKRLPRVLRSIRVVVEEED